MEINDKSVEFLRVKLWSDLFTKFYRGTITIQEALVACDKALEEFDQRFSK